MNTKNKDYGRKKGRTYGFPVSSTLHSDYELRPVRMLSYYRLVFIHFCHFLFQFATLFWSVADWQDILFCNFWSLRWLVRIANVYGFRAGISILYFLSVVSVPLCSVKLSGIYSQKFVGFLLAKLFSLMFHFSVCKAQFRL